VIANDPQFHVGDVLYDTRERNLGVILGRIVNTEAMPEALREYNLIEWVWKTYWARDGVQYYSDYSLRVLVGNAVLIRLNEKI